MNADLLATVREQAAQIAALDERIVRLEATVAGLSGKVSVHWVGVPDDQPAVIHHDIPPNAPR